MLRWSEIHTYYTVFYSAYFLLDEFIGELVWSWTNEMDVTHFMSGEMV